MSAAISTADLIASAVTLAIRWARDESHGYDQTLRWGPNYDCSSFLISIWEAMGVLVQKAGATYTGNMVQAFLRCGFKNVTNSVNLATGAGLQPGDVLVWHGQGNNGHTAMYIGNGQIVHAAGNEFGGATGGQAGDQTGREICVAPYFNSAKNPWQVVLRYAPDAAPPSESTSKPSSKGLYIVKPGDSLWKIADVQLGDFTRWEEIKSLNNLQDTVIHPGDELKLPSRSNLNTPGDDSSATTSPSNQPPTDTADGVSVVLPVLAEGDTGPVVRSLQALLLNANIDVGICGVDGEYGNDTWTAVCDFQRAHGLLITGKTDGNTWPLLLGARG